HFHTGLDIAAPQGTPIHAAAAGTVTAAGWNNYGYGYMVEIDHGNGLVTLYGHMMQQPSVSVGEQVSQGETIGYVGTTGNSTGDHCHFGVELNGVWVNPYNYLP
ncbi:MAG TPA: M23 family metallopeptidase, partial [Thermomicrobiaceae bacterium]|nr:M23 family metallopeptidase [Thermomicrobiaceae bacterium]